ncbi:hypothetical protein [Candidatus Protofrankia californiensis]|uniref:hypothetical protein n=1 Tax=Candidatus Protofrankia californiensis TaxID=1839754 RepID=UPI0010411521|nr:hypothetical protein [Candidatus Protofrankia californiensis]
MSSDDISPAPEHLYTWVDVDEYFTSLATRGAWPAWLLEIDAFWDGVELTITEDVRPPEVWAWLTERLGPLTVDADREDVLLESANGSGRPLPVRLRPAPQVEKVERRPRWHERRIVRQLAEGIPAPDKAAFPHDVQICAFHSFKGGVGRTLHCVALARELAGRPGRDGIPSCSSTPIWRLQGSPGCSPPRASGWTSPWRTFSRFSTARPPRTETRSSR